MKEENAEILIVGAGPTGLTLACELRRRGVSCRIIDKNKAPSLHSKALGVSATSLLIFERLGFADKLVNDGIKMEDTYFFWKKKKFMHINYRYLKNITKYPFMLLIHQTETEKYLDHCLETFNGKVERGVALSDLTQDEDQVSVTLMNDKKVERAIFKKVIGCDGSQSTVRELLKVPFRGKDYGLHFIYADVELENWFGDGKIANYYIDESNLLIIIPTPNNIFRIVGLIPGEKSQRPMPSLEDMQHYIDRFGPGNIKLKNPTQFGSVPIYYRLAANNRIGNVYLAGDAFHLFSPIGGQGMNAGIQDAYNLAWKLAYIKQGHAKSSLLKTYEPERLTLMKKLIADVEKSIQFLIRNDKENDEITKSVSPVFSNRNLMRNKYPRNYSGFNYQYEQDNFLRNPNKNCNLIPENATGSYTQDFLALHTESNHLLIIYLSDTENQPSLIEEIKKIVINYSFINIRSEITNKLSYFTLVGPDGYVCCQSILTEYNKLKCYLEDFFIKASENDTSK